MLLVTLTWRTHIKNTLVWVMRIGSVYCRQVWKSCWHWAFKKYFSCEWKTRWKESLVLLGIMWNQYNKEILNKRKKTEQEQRFYCYLFTLYWWMPNVIRMLTGLSSPLLCLPTAAPAWVLWLCLSWGSLAGDAHRLPPHTNSLWTTYVGDLISLSSVW